MSIIHTIRPDSEYDGWQSQDMPPSIFVECLVNALKIACIESVYPFRMISSRKGSGEYASWFVEGAYDDNKVIGYFSITIMDAGKPWTGFACVYRYFIRGVNTKRGLFSYKIPTNIILDAITIAKSDYLIKYGDDHKEIEDCKLKLKELREQISPLK